MDISEKVTSDNNDAKFNANKNLKYMATEI